MTLIYVVSILLVILIAALAAIRRRTAKWTQVLSVSEEQRLERRALEQKSRLRELVSQSLK